MAEASACRACGSVDTEDLGACASFPASVLEGLDAQQCPPGRLLRCRACGLGQRQPCLEGEALIEMYRRQPADTMDYQFEENVAWREARRQLLAHHPTDAPASILDIGCHTGVFLGGLPANWRRYGVESAAGPIQDASGVRGVQIIAERLETVPDEWRGRFDAVTLFDVVEHLPDPAAGIARAAQLLRPGGVLIVSSGDLDAWTWRWLGAGHWYLQTPQHLSVVSRRFFELFANSHALALRDVRRIPHQRSTRGVRWQETIKALYWGMRCRRQSLYRLGHRLLQSLPGLRDLRHMQSVPWTLAISDHVFAVLSTQPGGHVQQG